MVMETVCARHAKTAGQRAQHDAIEAEHEVANNAIAAALASGVAGVAALPVAGLVSVDGNGVIVLGPTGLTAARISQLQTKLDTAVGAGKARVI